MYKTVEEVILRNIDDRLDNLRNRLIAGGCASWEEYRETVGRYHEVNEIREIIRNSRTTAN